MIFFAGSVRGRRQEPYIYAIAKQYCLYIGETQQHPVARWGQHLTITGSFSNRLRSVDTDLWESNDEIMFLCFKCVTISSLASEEHKLVTRFVEHKVHELCILNLASLAPIEMIISDTTRTAPARCRYDWAGALANEVFIGIKNHLERLSPK